MSRSATPMSRMFKKKQAADAGQPEAEEKGAEMSTDSVEDRGTLSRQGSKSRAATPMTRAFNARKGEAATGLDPGSRERASTAQPLRPGEAAPPRKAFPPPSDSATRTLTDRKGNEAGDGDGGGGGGGGGPPKGVTAAAHYTINLNKAQRLLGEIQKRQVMYITAAQHFDKVNNSKYVVPGLLVNSFASFVSFCASSTLIPVTIRSILALFVGLLGTITTIITAMKAAYKYDTKAEMFRAAAGEYRLLATRVSAEMRKDPDGVGPNWEALWNTMENQILEIQKKMPFFPPQDLVVMWTRQGKFDSNEVKGDLSAWLFKYRIQLEGDGITGDSDIMGIEEDQFEEFIAEKRYPLSIIHKMQHLSEQLKEMEKAKLQVSGADQVDLSVDKHLEALRFKVTTLTALRLQGIGELKDLRLCTDDFLDRILIILLQQGKPPALITWTKFELLIAEVRKGGKPKLGRYKKTPLSEAADNRIARIAAAHDAIEDDENWTA